MNSKKKNKNKQNKPPNPTPPQKEEVTESVSPPEEVIERIVEDRVPNIVSENVTEVKESQGSEDTPKKPKRNRGKKKKDDEKSDKEDDIKIEEPIPVVPTPTAEDALSEFNVAPTARKKKNKNKKSQEPVPEEKQDEKKIVSEVKLETSDESQEVPIQKEEETAVESKCSKKKNKKKKNRNDSERSEKEEVSCISAFQQLLVEDEKTKEKTEKATKSATDQGHGKEIQVTSPANVVADVKGKEEALPKDEANKNKKKNKKDKKLPSDDQPKSSEEITIPDLMKTDDTAVTSEKEELLSQVKDIVEPIKLDESTPDATAVVQKSHKQKAKIAKPVDKKKKGKEESEKNFEEKAECVEKSNVSETVLAKHETLETVESDKMILKTEIGPDWHEEVKIDEKTVTVIACENKDKNNVLLQLTENVEKNEKRKKSPKPAKTKQKPITPEPPTETEPQVSKCEETKAIEDTLSLPLEIKPKEIQITDDKIEQLKAPSQTETKSKGKKSPKPQRKNESVSLEVMTTVVPETEIKQTSEPGAIKTDDTNLLKEASSTVKEEIEPGESPVGLPVTSIVEEVRKDEMERIPTPDYEKRQKRKKSPKPQRKNELVSLEVMTTVVPESEIKQTSEPEAIKTDSTNLLKQASSTIKEEIMPEEPPVELPMTNIAEEVRKDEIERIPTPDYEKRQKRKKSPKPPIDIEKSAGSKGKPKHGTINIDDIIIIQAEVVSEEKAQKSDTFIASSDNVPFQGDRQQAEVRPGTKKNKKGEKSPKPTKKDLFPEFKAVEQIEVKDSQVDVQMPVTPKPSSTIPLPGTIPVELEVPKAEPIPSPSDVTPDLIEYPRCSSEQLLDSNNNTVIQEISNVETKLRVLTDIPDTPFIKSTDLFTPEVSGVKVIKADPVKKSADEKTDLKSKVMEVNQDMEELRLSIERSLAELTSLDKTDTENEIKLEECKKKYTEIAEKESVPVVPKGEQVPDLAKLEDVPCETKEDLVKDKLNQEPVCPERKDRKGKSKSKKKGKHEVVQSPDSGSSSATTTSTTTDTKESTEVKDDKKEDKKSEQNTEKTQEKGKQQASGMKENKDDEPIPHSEGSTDSSFEPIENFEDAMTSSVDDVNKTFEIIANEANPRLEMSQNNPEINVIAPEEDKGGRQEKQNPVSPPKNLLGHPDIPVPSSRTDYKKEKNKTPNYRQAKVKIKDLNDDQTPEKSKESKESQTENKRKFIDQKRPDESICVTNKNEDYIYKYSFRKVFLQCACHVCKKDLSLSRVPCSFCNLIFYCNQKHKDEDYAQHQAFCFAVSTICHLKDQKFIYADARDVTGHNYRLLRMQTIVSCEKVLKRRLAAWEQEALLYPRLCARAACREWRQGRLADCGGCGQISYCSEYPDHLPPSHARWCKSYNLYRSLVRHQQTLGRLEPPLPSRVLALDPLPDNINEVLASMYEERIDMSDIEYAALTQLATAPLTALYCLQASRRTANGVTKKSTLTLHVVGAELQFEADVLSKWEVFLLHLLPQVRELRVALVGPDLNPSNLPLELLGKIRLCDNCQQSNRRVVFDFQDKRTYHEFWASDHFTTPDLVCAFNPGIQRSSTYGRDSWPATIACILKLRVPLAITAHSLAELGGELASAGGRALCPPRPNCFASVRPDRNFITDDEAPLLFKNHCVAVVCGV